MFTYLAPTNVRVEREGSVLSFRADSWPIFPQANAKVRGAYERAAEYGSLVKLYEYRWQATKSNIVQSGGGLLRRIEESLVDVALPVRVFECRAGYRGHAGSFATNMLGLAARLERDRASNLEPSFPLGTPLTLEDRRIRMRVFVFRKGKADEYRTRQHGVVFTLNGQTHASLPIDFFRRKDVGMSYLADSLFVIVDCTSIDGTMREDLFMNSRDRLRKGSVSDELEREVKDFLRHNPALEKLRNQRRQEELEDRLNEAKPLAEALEQLVRRSPALARLLLGGTQIPSPFPPKKSDKTTEGQRDFEGKRFPTFFRFEKLSEGMVLERTASINSRARIPFETDAEDGYFDREIEPGKPLLFVESEGVLLSAKTWFLPDPRSGATNLTLTLPPEVRKADRIAFELHVSDNSRLTPFVNRFVLTVAGPREPHSGPPGSRERLATFRVVRRMTAQAYGCRTR